MACWLFPAKVAAVSVASSAGVLGLFMVGLLIPRLMRKPLELACLAPFAILATSKR